MTDAEFREAYGRHKDMLYRFARRMTASESAAEDLVHDCFLLVWRNKLTYRTERGELRNYLIGLIRNLAMKRLDKARQLWEQDLEENAAVCQPIDPTGRERGEIVAEAVAGLPLLQRETLILAEYEEMPLAEITSIRGTRMAAVASTLLDLITSAYDLRYDQISGGPGWVKSDHFDIVARAGGEGPVTKAQLRQMLQSLLAERFQLKVHREEKEIPMYALVVSKSGPKLKQVPPETEGADGWIRASNSVMHMSVSKGTMEQLALRLSGNGAGRPVLDKTALTGQYAFTLDWVNGTPAADSDTPSLFVAIQEQLGLKLEPTRGPAQMLVIDHAEKPSEN